LIEELGLQLVCALDTHCHADHQATVILRESGLERVANLRGGMLLWRQMGLPSVRTA
jgi:rhodanese-related sulfurtransferase